MRKNYHRRQRCRKRLVITKHFCDKWRDRYGYAPGESEISGILERSVLAQRCRRVNHDVMPAVYVDFDRNVCVLVDETPGASSRMITFLSDQDMNSKVGSGDGFVPLAEIVEHVSV